MSSIKEENGAFWCIDCYLTKMAKIQGFAICPFCENNQELTE